MASKGKVNENDVKRKRKKNIDTFQTPIRKVHDDQGGDMGVRMSMNSKSVIDSLVKYTFRLFSKNINLLLESSNQKTVKADTVLSAMRLSFGSSLAGSFTTILNDIGKIVQKSPVKVNRSTLFVGLGPTTRFLKKNLSGNPRIGMGAKVAMSMLTAELIKIIWKKSHEVAVDAKSKTINARFVKLAIMGDEGLYEAFHNIILPGGVIVHTLPSRQKRGKKEVTRKKSSTKKAQPQPQKKTARRKSPRTTKTRSTVRVRKNK